MRFAPFFFCLTSFLSLLHAEIMELNSFEDLPSYLTKETLVVLDIDDTILIPVQMFGCDEWFTHQLRKYQKAMGFEEALEKALTEWEAVRQLTQMEIVEPGTEQVIENLQKDGFTLMGLTTQRLVLSVRTVAQLLEQKVNFSKSAPSEKDHYFQRQGQGILYKAGILFTSGTHKGESLFHLCSLMDHAPRRIVFVNDKATHLREVEISAEKRGVEFIGLRYSYSDSRKKAFLPEIAEYQFFNSSFINLLSDKEALERGFR